MLDVFLTNTRIFSLFQSSLINIKIKIPTFALHFAKHATRKCAFRVNVFRFRVYAVVEKQNDVTRLSRNSNTKNKETKQ